MEFYTVAHYIKQTINYKQSGHGLERKDKSPSSVSPSSNFTLSDYNNSWGCIPGWEEDTKKTTIYIYSVYQSFPISQWRHKASLLISKRHRKIHFFSSYSNIQNRKQDFQQSKSLCCLSVWRIREITRNSQKFFPRAINLGLHRTTNTHSKWSGSGLLFIAYLLTHLLLCGLNWTETLS